MNYVGLRWYKCDFHLHTMVSPCYKDKTNTIDQWLDEVERKGLNCIAVTDHNDYRSIDEIVLKAKNKGITVFPGVEVTCDSSKIHVLILFDTNKEADDVREFLASIDIKKDSVEKGIGTSKSIFDICKKAKESGCIVIPAHIDDYNGINNMSDFALKKLFNSEFIDAFQVANQEIWMLPKNEQLEKINEKYGVENISDETMQKWRKTFKKAIQTVFPVIMSSDNPHSEYESGHGLWGIGHSYTWIKMGDNPNLESLRQAFFAPDERIKTCFESVEIPENLPELWIESVSVNGTTISPYIGIDIFFNPQLNSIIGGRGSGKSSIIRTITGLLRSGNFNDMNTIKEEQEDFYKVEDSRTGKGILKENSLIEIKIFRNGTLYKISETGFKKGSSEIKIQKYKIESDEWEDVQNEFINFFEIDAYTQKQIYELAQAPDALSNLIDKDITGLDDLKIMSRECRSNLTDKIKEIREAEEKLTVENKLKIELKDIKEQINVFKRSGITDAIEQKQMKEDEKKQINDYLKNIQLIGDEIVQWTDGKYLDKPNSKLPDEVKLILEQIKNDVEKKIQSVKELGEEIISEYDKTKKKIDNTQWAKDYEKAQNKFNEAKDSLEQQKLRAEKLDELLEAQKQKENELQEIMCVKESLDKMNKEKCNLENEYKKSLKEIRKCRKQFVDDVLEGKTDIKIEYIEQKSSKSVENMMFELIQNPSASVVDDIEKVAEMMVQNDGVEKFRKMITNIISGEEVQNVNTYFKKAIKKLNPSLVDQMMSFIPEDELQVSYKSSNGRFIPLVTASPGQKTTAILTFILAYGIKPLLLDQPEDDLDNRLVYDLVVKQLKESKKHRQIIVVTHNANIPVNGDSEFIISMDSASRYVKTKSSGTMDDKNIRDEICDVMEGTEYAFEMRAKKYHLNISE